MGDGPPPLGGWRLQNYIGFLGPALRCAAGRGGSGGRPERTHSVRPFRVGAVMEGGPGTPSEQEGNACVGPPASRARAGARGPGRAAAGGWVSGLLL